MEVAVKCLLITGKRLIVGWQNRRCLPPFAALNDQKRFAPQTNRVSLDIASVIEKSRLKLFSNVFLH